MLRFLIFASLAEIPFAIHERHSFANPSIESPRFRRVTGVVQHVTVRGNALSTTYQPFQEILSRDKQVIEKIPHTLHYVSNENAVESLPTTIQQNLQKEIGRNTGFTVKYWGNDACHDYLLAYFSKELLDKFDDATRGLNGRSYRFDICRAAVLYREGGFYMDVDTELAAPLVDFIDDTTSFMGVRHSNMLMAAVPNHEILDDTIEQILPWYKDFDEGVKNGILGSTTLEGAFNKRCECGMNCDPFGVKFKCGEYVIKLYTELPITCAVQSMECPASRVNQIQKLMSERKSFGHLKFAIMAPSRKVVVGWNRFESCDEYGCGTRDFQEKDWVDMSQDGVLAMYQNLDETPVVQIPSPAAVTPSPTNHGAPGIMDSIIMPGMAPPLPYPSNPPAPGVLSPLFVPGPAPPMPFPSNPAAPGVMSPIFVPGPAPQMSYPLTNSPQGAITQFQPPNGQSGPMTVLNPIVMPMR